MGVIAVDADDNICESFYEFGLNLGVLFQLQDDYLDVFGEENIFGKVFWMSWKFFLDVMDKFFECNLLFCGTHFWMSWTN